MTYALVSPHMARSTRVALLSRSKPALISRSVPSNAIEYAYSRGVLLRDIKPGNIIVGRHGKTLVVAWGLQGHRKAEPGEEERTLMPHSASGSAETLPGSALGTPAYISPEQAHREIVNLGPRSEVYSLGVTVY